VNVPYPHRVDILRAGDTGLQDGYGRPLLSDFLPVTVNVAAWVQEISTQEQQLLSQAGGLKITHRVFTDLIDVSEADLLGWTDNRGRSVRLEIVEVTDPDGTGDHLEIMAFERHPAPPFPMAS
jgi:hypothetical protein